MREIQRRTKLPPPPTGESFAAALQRGFPPLQPSSWRPQPALSLTALTFAVPCDKIPHKLDAVRSFVRTTSDHVFKNRAVRAA
jgi:hypothetical protein